MIDHKVLVLNQDFTPLTLCAVSKAFLLVHLNKAEVLENASRIYLRTVKVTYAFSSIIRLKRYIHLPYKRVTLTRQNVFRRDHHQCQYCGATDRDLTLDHVFPKSRGGQSKWDNLTTACKKCNFKKGDLTPEEAGMILRKRPYTPTFIMLMHDVSTDIDQSWLPFLSMKGVNT